MSGEGPHDEITIIDVVGMTRAEAEAALRRSGLTGDIVPDNSPGTRVCGTVPGAGRKSLAHLSILLKICEHPEPASTNNPDD